jgi:hypothetical protein
MNAFVRLFVLASMAASAFAGDPTGKWKATYDTPNGQTVESTFDLKADGSTLTGIVTGRRGESKIEEGKVDGDNVSFSVTRNFNGQDVKLLYKGKIEGDDLKLNVSFGQDRNFDIVAKRQK